MYATCLRKGTRVIGLMELKKTIASIKEAIENKLSHPFLARYVVKPFIDEDKLLLFYTLFKEADIPESEIHEYCTTAMLVQIALDTHDLVGNDKCNEREKFVERQLTVLAGDYFSGLYYAILADLKDVKMIQVLANAIKEINESKIQLYHSTHSLEEQLECLKKIEGALSFQLGVHMNQSSFASFACHYLTYKRICEEADRLNEGDSSIFIESLKRTKYNEQQMKSKLFDVSQKWYEQVIAFLNSNRVHSQALIDYLYDRIHTMQYSHQHMLNKMVEEG